MEGQAYFPVIKAINKAVVHKICSGQVILDLSSAVKELVENSLDAGASNIEINLKEHGEEFFKVIDNGCGISPDNFQAFARKYHTSKIMDFSDLHSLTTFGFRGEALSSLCALSSLTVETRTKNEMVGTHLTFDHTGSVTAERKTARQVGTTVTIGKLFSTLPVRQKEFSRNLRREYGKMTSLLNAYALMAKGVRFLCTNSNKNLKSVALKTQGNGSIKENIIAVLGLNTFQCLEPLNMQISECCTIEGFLSKPDYGSGRNMGDRQFFFINGRPVDMPKVSKLLNEVYKSSNSKQYPVAIMNFIIPTTLYDVNVTPDKRKVFISDESSLMLTLRAEIEKIYSPHQCSYPVNSIKRSSKEADESSQHINLEDDNQSPSAVLKLFSPDDNENMKRAGSVKQVMDDVSPMNFRVSNQDIDMQSGFDFDEDNSPGEVFRNSVSENNKLKNISNHCLMQSTYVKPTTTVDVKTPSSSRKKDITCHSNLVQSPLSMFLAVNKRKHENSCSILSEMPVLRDKRTSSPIRKKGSDTDVLALETDFCISEGDTFRAEADKSEQDHRANIASKKVESFCSMKSGIFERDSNTDNLEEHNAAFSISEIVLEGPSGKKLETKSELSTLCLSQGSHDLNINMLKACSGQKTYPVLQFSIYDLRKRRNKWMSGLFSVKSTAEGRIQSCYSAATLANSQPENDDGKADFLTAAVIELERFFRKEDFGRMQVIGQFNLGFIIGKLDQDLFIVDQHAADEKYNFERISKSTIINQQPLFKPIRLELSPEEEVVASVNVDIIRKNGFLLMEDMHALPGYRFLLKAVPFSKNVTFGVEDLKDLICTLADSEGECSIISSYKMECSDSICPSKVRAMFASRACRMSIMIGDPLTKSEMQKILDNLVDLKSPWNCPHGRPTMRHLIDLTTLHNRRSEVEPLAIF